jgi:hypothetical protein
MLSKRNRRNKKHSKKITRICGGGVKSLVRVSNNFYSKLKTVVSEYSKLLKDDGIVTKLVPQYNCNFDLEFSCQLYNTAKIAYTVFMKQFMGNPDDIRTEILKFNPFDELLTGEQEKIDYISRIFDIFSNKNYIYILYLLLYRDRKEKKDNSVTITLKSYLERNHFKDLSSDDKERQINSIIQTIEEYDNKVSTLKVTGTIEGSSLEEINVFKIIMVTLQVFHQTLREFGNISISINNEDKIDKNTSKIGELYNEKSYLLFEEIITNILQVLTENPNSSICTFILFLFFPVSTDMIGHFLYVFLPRSNTLLKDGSNNEDPPGFFSPKNNLETGTLSQENRVFFNNLINKPTSLQSRYVNKLFPNMSNIKNTSIIEFLKKGNYINIIINAINFYMETTDVWGLFFTNATTNKEIILGFVVITSIYDFKKLTYKNINQIRWYTNITKEKFNEVTQNYYELSDCIKYDTSASINLIAEEQQEEEEEEEEEEDDGQPRSRLFPAIAIGSLVTTGAVLGTLFGLGIIGGKTKKKRILRKGKNMVKVKTNRKSRKKKN